MDSNSRAAEVDIQHASPVRSVDHQSDTVCVLWFLTGLMAEPGTVRSMLIHSTPFTVGRRGDQHLCLEVATVSARHAEFLENGDRLLIRDLGSTNGTFVNGQRIQEPTELKANDLVQFAEQAFRVRRQTSVYEAHTQREHLCDQALSLVQFDRLMNDRAVTPFYQPIVDMRTSRIVGQEVLARSQIFGLEMPQAMFQAAAQLDLAMELSRMFRCEGIRYVPSHSTSTLLFVNTHPCELSAPGLIESLAVIRKTNPGQPLVLEVHEAAMTSAASMRELRAGLADLDILLAYDDFGAGQNRLVELIEVPPDFLKFDMALVRDLDQSQHRQQLLSTLVQMARDLNIVTLAEGIETPGERDACREIGFELAQGFLFGKPMHATDLVRSTMSYSAIKPGPRSA